MVGSNDFNFSQDELDLLFSIKYCALKETIREYRVGALSSLIRSKETTVNKEDETKTLKNLWLNEWHDKTVHLLKIKKIIEFSDLGSEIKKHNFSSGKLSAVITECATFFPFYPLDEKDKRFKKLELDVKTYLKKLTLVLPESYSKMNGCREAFQDSIKRITKDISKGSNLLLWTSVLALIAVILAPTFAGWIGTTFLGLHGAAAVSAGLALLGGGAIAVGGFGMAGGTIAIMVGGALIGYSVGNSKYKAHVRGLSNEEILLFCAKLISFIKVYDKDKELIIRDICKSSRLLQMDLEEDADEYFISHLKGKLDKNKSKDLKRKPATLVAFRRYLRTMK